MATKKITDLVELISAASGDVLPIVDISDDITKKIQVSNFPISTATQSAIDAKQDTLVSGTNIKTLNSESLLGSGNIEITASPAGVAGAIQFSDGSSFASDAANLFWNDTNNRLGIGTNTPSHTLHVTGGSARLLNILVGSVGNTAISNTNADTTINVNNGVGIAGNPIITPTARLHVKGSGTTSATTALLVQNSAGTNLLKVDDSGFGFYVNDDEDGKVRLYADGQTGIIIGNRNLRINSGGGNALNISGSGTNGVIIGSSLPTLAANTALVVRGQGSTSATTSFLVQNSAGTTILSVKDGGADKQVTMNSAQIGSIELVGRNIATGGGNTITLGYNPLLIGGLIIDNSAILQADSTTKGFLPPRMTTTQKNAIATPASGLMVYDSTTNKLCCYNGSSWNDLF